jgi:hypothetical protein
MKKLETALGEVTILDTRINRSSGYGQYTIAIEIEFEGNKKTISLHSTDSQLFDKAHGEDDHSEIVMNGAKSTIERAVEDYIHSL